MSTKIDAAGIAGATFHALRHTHASMLIAKGINVKVVADRLGHSSPAVTLSIYGHLIAGLGETAATAIGDVLYGGTEAPSEVQLMVQLTQRKSTENDGLQRKQANRCKA